MMPLLWPTYFVGDEKKAPLLLLHGFMGSHKDWLPIAEELQKEFYCIIPDLPGHGGNLSEREFERELSLPYIAQGAKVILDQLGIKQANVIGYSMGGRVAVHMALNHPEKVGKLVLENANPGLKDIKKREERARIDVERAEKIRDDLDGFIDTWYQAGLFSSLAAHGARFEALKAVRKLNDARWIAKAIAELSPGAQDSVWGRLSELSMPVQLVGGAYDAKYQGILDEMRQMIPDVKLTVIEETGHNVHFEQSENFIKVVREFLLEIN